MNIGLIQIKTNKICSYTKQPGLHGAIKCPTLSQHLVSRDITVSPLPSPPNFTIWGGRQKKIFGANAPTPSPPNLEPSLRPWIIDTICTMFDYGLWTGGGELVADDILTFFLNVKSCSCSHSLVCTLLL